MLMLAILAWFLTLSLFWISVSQSGSLFRQLIGASDFINQNYKAFLAIGLLVSLAATLNLQRSASPACTQAKAAAKQENTSSATPRKLPQDRKTTYIYYSKPKGRTCGQGQSAEQVRVYICE